MTWTPLLPEPDRLGESPFWHPLEEQLYWIDIPGRLLHRARPERGRRESWPLPAEPGCIAPARSGGLVLALRDGIYRARQWRGPLEKWVDAPYDPAQQRFNDGKCDARGRLWSGTIHEPRDAPRAQVYSLDPRSAPRVLQPRLQQLTVSNGLAWSPDARTLYWADTTAHCVYSAGCDAQGDVSGPPRVFRQFAPKPAGWTWDGAARRADGGLSGMDPSVAGRRHGAPSDPGSPGLDTPYGGRPDGAAVDEDGCYIVAMFEGARLCRLAPDGRLLEHIELPVQCPTMPCYGGADRRTLYVTTARQGRGAAELAAQPWAGCVLQMRVQTPGLPVQFFDD